MKLSSAALFYALYIVISAAFLLQIRNWLFRIFGAAVVTNTFRGFFFLVAFLALFFAKRRGLALFKQGLILSLFILAYIFSQWQPYFSEKTHVLTYGLLGYLALRDLGGNCKKWHFKGILFAIAFVALVSAADELFQGILPYRYCEFRDFISNIISGSFGMALLLIIKRRAPDGRA